MEKYYRVSAVNEILNKLAKEPAYYHEGEDFYNGVCAVEGELMCLDSVELEEPKVGEWEKHYDGFHDMIETVCSNCYRTGATHFKYCPNCGTRMIKE